MSEATPTEAESLLSVLERNRRTFAWKTAGLDEKGLRATTAASTMTLGGLIKHVALVEADWLAVKMAGQGYGTPWDTVDFEADADWDWRTGATDAPEEVYAVWQAAVERSRKLVPDVIEERGLDGPASFTWPNGRTPTLLRPAMGTAAADVRSGRPARGHLGHGPVGNRGGATAAPPPPQQRSLWDGLRRR